MPNAEDVRLLNRLDRLIRKYSLHSMGGLLIPVNLDPVLEKYHLKYKDMPEDVKGVTLQTKRKRRREEVDMWYNAELRELSKSAEERWTKAHELAHVLCKHRGREYILQDPKQRSRCTSYGGYMQSAFDKWLLDKEERESELVAAYLLVPLAALLEMSGAERWYLARMLDVPEHLIEVRQRIFVRWKR